MTLAAAAPLTTRRLLWSAAIVVGASLPHWLVLPPWMPVLLCACAAWRVLAAHRRWRVPGRRLRIVLALGLLAAVLGRYRTVNGLEAGSALLVVMVALKLVEASTHRDELVLMIISYFLVFASLLEHQGLLIGAYLLVFVLATTAGLLQLGRRGPLLPLSAAASLAGKLLLKALPIMAVLFVLFPRLSGPLWALPSTPERGATGLSGSMSPGDITALAASDEVAFRAEFEGAAPPADRLYWRGPVLTRFNGRTWTGNFTAARRGDPADIEYLGEPAEYRVTLEPNASGWAFTLDLPRRWSADERLVLTDGYQLVARARRDQGSRLDYRAVSHTRYRTLAPLSDIEQTTYRRLPDRSNPRTRVLAAGWREQGLSAEEIVEAALDYLRDRPFRYTLTPAALGAHSADEFLFDTLEGFCEHYASAFAVMMRAAGVPARVVTGYLGGELNAFARHYTIRQSDAHAWTEVWIAGRGWMRVDPTGVVAPERIELGANAGALDARGGGSGGLGLIRTARHAWDAVNVYWYGWVVSFGSTTQRALLERLGFVRPTLGVLAGLAAASVAALLVLLNLGHTLRGLRGRRRVDPAARWFRLACRRLERRRVPPPGPGEAPRAYAARAAAALPGCGTEIEHIASAYLSARYEPDPRGAALRDLRALVRAFRPLSA